jgi:hypothetical protein
MFRALALVVVLLVFGPACSAASPAGTAGAKDDDAPATLVALAGGAQTGRVAMPLADSLAVRLLDGGGDPVAGGSVTWQVVSGGGQVSAARTGVDAEGRASVAWTLGSRAGAQQARAAVPGGAAVRFTATATPGPVATVDVRPTTVTLAPGDTTRLRATAADVYGNAVPDPDLRWRSSVPGVASVSGAGLVTGRTPGSTVVTATSGAASGHAHAAVGPGPDPARTVFFTEDFEDDAFADRGWYDNTDLPTTAAERWGGERSLEIRFDAGRVLPTFGGAVRRRFPPSASLYISYRVKYGEEWRGSGVGYHPHEFYVLTDRDGAWTGPARTHLTLYVETSVREGGILPALQMGDALNIDTDRIGVDLTAVTEERAVAGCNGETDGYPTSCGGSGERWGNGKRWRADRWSRVAGSPAISRGEWHHVEVEFVMNSIQDGVGIPDGRIRYWLDGTLLVDLPDVLFRTGAWSDMRMNQFLLGPYIGVGSPITQTFWIDDLEVADRR